VTQETNILKNKNEVPGITTGPASKKKKKQVLDRKTARPKRQTKTHVWGRRRFMGEKKKKKKRA
jgi:hypothetical protein